jgi:hypothetical protein
LTAEGKLAPLAAVRQLIAYVHHAHALRALAETPVFRAPSPPETPCVPFWDCALQFLDPPKPLMSPN